MEKQSLTNRRYDLDWMRVIAILCVFFFHSVRFFNLDPWSAKNAVTYHAAQYFTNFLDVWMMPFIFLISGASLFFALDKGKRGEKVGKFVKDKVLRLLVPLVVGVFTYTIPVVYLDRVANGKFSGSFWEFVPHYFDGVFMGSTENGNFAFHGLHLWYLEVLFVYSLILLPLFLFLKSPRGARILNGLTRVMAIPGVFYVLLALPVVLCETFLDHSAWYGHHFFSWSFPVYLCFFVAGFEIISSERLQNSILRMRWVSLILAGATTVLWIMTDEHGDVTSWAWVLTFLGFGMKHLNRNPAFLGYASEAVLPFYIEHQTVLICIGFFVVLWPIVDPLKWGIIAVSSFAVCIGFYEFLVRRNNVMRVLFGMKPLKKMALPETLKEKAMIGVQ